MSALRSVSMDFSVWGISHRWHWPFALNAYILSSAYIPVRSVLGSNDDVTFQSDPPLSTSGLSYFQVTHRGKEETLFLPVGVPFINYT